jgi:hypothetical protein
METAKEQKHFRSVELTKIIFVWQIALTPALSHPMGEGEQLNPSSATGRCLSLEPSSGFPSPIRWERVRVRVRRVPTQLPVFNSTTSCGAASRCPAGLTRM